MTNRIVVGTIQATLPCDLETFRCRLIWLEMLALDKTERKKQIAQPHFSQPREAKRSSRSEIE